MPVAPVMISGARDTTNHQAARQIVDMGDLHQLENDKAKLFTMVAKLGKKKAHNQKIDWMEDQLNPKATTVNGAIASGITALVVATGTGAYFRAGDRVKVPRTGEVVSVTSVATDTLTVVRAAGNTAAAAIVDTDPLLILSNASGQGSTLFAARSTKETLASNYMQILRSPYKVTGTEARIAKAGGHYVEGDLVTQRRKKALEHARDINLTAYWGENKLTSGTGQAGGVFERIPTANVISTGTLTETGLNTALKTIFRYGSSTKTLFCSRQVAGIIDGLLRDRLRMAVGDKTGGNHFTTYASTHGVINIVPDHAIEGGVYDGYAVVVDADGPEFVTLQDTILKTGLASNDEDSEVEEYFSEFSFRWGNGNTHGALTGVA